MALITKIWSASAFQRGVSAHEEYLATGFTDAEAARSASPIQVGQKFNLDSRLIAQQPTVSTPDSPQNFILGIDYALPPGIGTADQSLLTTPPTYYPDIQTKDEPIDRDIYGNAITNSAGDPPNKDVTEEVPSIIYTYKRYEAAYDGQKALAFTGKTCSDTFVMPGFGRVSKGQAKCKSIRTDKEFDASVKAVLMIYTFEIREDGFKKRLLDKGRRGWSATAADGGFIDDIYTSNGKQITDDVLLNGAGIPIDTDNYVIGEAKDTPIEHGFGWNGIVEKEKTILAVYLKYETAKSIAFSGLNLEP